MLKHPAWVAKPRCIGGHHLKTRDPQQLRNVTYDALVTCVHQERREAPACGTRQYVSLNTFGGSAAVRGTGERWWLVVEVTDTHVRATRERPMIFLGRMTLLACVPPGEANQCNVRHSRLSDPLKASQTQLSTGLPGRLKSSRTRFQ